MTQPPPGYVPPPPGYRVDPGLPPPYPPGQQPLPPRQPRRSSPVIAPLVALIALVLVAGGSFGLFTFMSATLETAAADPSADPGAVVAATPEPTASASESTDDPEASSDPAAEPTVEPVASEEPEGTAEPITVVPPSDERADVAGSILFTRLGGDVWSASGTTLTPLTNSSSIKADQGPTWSPDGKWVYFIRSTKREVKAGQARYDGKYTLYPTDLMKMRADGSGKPVKVYDATIRDSRGQWFSTVLQPSVSPAGDNVAVVSDGSDGDNAGVELHIIDSRSKRMRKVSAPSQTQGIIRLGHNDPDFNSNGTKIAYTFNDNNGTEGDPRIGIFTCRTKSNCTVGKAKLLRAGYANPSWSPDDKLLAVETTDGTGRDIAIITANGGHERVRLTTNGDSFAPEFSPDGTHVAYLHRDGLGIDVRVMTLDIDDKGKISLVQDKAVTSDGEVDGESGISWYLPRSQRPQAPSDDAVATESSAEPADALEEGAPPPPPGS